MATFDISGPGDVFDIRDVIERFEEVESEIADSESPLEPDDALCQERDALAEFLAEVKGPGGDHQWRGDWYPLTFVSDSNFEDYARELAEDIGTVDSNAKWPNNHIDWSAAAEELKNDYSSTEVGSAGEYWYR